MIRVLQVTGGMDRAGLETFIMNVYRKIDRTKIQFDFVIYKNTADYWSEIEELGGHVYVLPRRRHNIRKYRNALEEFFRVNAYKYNAIHLHVWSLSMLESLEFAKKYGIPNRIIHGHSYNQRGIINKILHLLHKPIIHKLATNYYACSEEAISWMYGFTKIKNKSEIIKNGIDVTSFKYDIDKRERYREKLNIPKDTFVIGHIGRFEKEKNHTFLINVFCEYCKLNNNTKLLLVGDGSLKENVNEQVLKLGLTDKVVLLGKRTDICELLQTIDCFVMPSIFEGLPVTLVEAQAAGLPIFASTGISEISKIIPTYYPISLDMSIKYWAKLIDDKMKTFQRMDTSNILKDAGFDITTTVKTLSEIYCK